MSSTAPEVSPSAEVELRSQLAGYFHCDSPDVVAWFRGSSTDDAAATLVGDRAGVVGSGARDVDGIVAAASTSERAERAAAAYHDSGAQAVEMGCVVYDPNSDRLVLAGPLYYVEHGGGVVFASSVASLFACGAIVPAANDDAVIRFLATGASDEGDVTFFQGIRRVPVGYVLQCERDSVALMPGRPTSASETMQQEAAVRFGQGILGADLVARYPEAQVYHASFGPLNDSEDRYISKALAALRSEASAISVQTDTETLSKDFSDFIRTLGEPVPDVTSYLHYAVAATASTAGIRTLIDPVVATDPNPRKPINPEKLLRSGLQSYSAPVMDRRSVWSRVSEQLRTRFNVGLITPYVDDPDREPVVPPAAARVVGGVRPAVPLRDWLLRLKNRIYELFHSESFVSRPWFNELAVREAFEGFIKGRNTDAEFFWRAIMVELWAQEFLDPAPEQQEAPAIKGPLEPNARKQLEINVGDEKWIRIPIRTDLFDKGDSITEKISGYVIPTVELAAQKAEYREAFTRPWYLLVSEKIVAIAQGRSYFVWEIEPSWWARTLSKYVVKTPYGIGLGSPWTMQLAINEAGLPRILFASVVGAAGKLVGKRGLFYQLAGHSVRAIDGPTEYSVYPANVSAKLPPAEPDKVAAQVRSATTDALAAKDLAGVADTLAGCVVIDANDIGRNVLGMSADKSETFFEELFADNPLGQGSEQTPLAVAIQLTK